MAVYITSSTSRGCGTQSGWDDISRVAIRSRSLAFRTRTGPGGVASSHDDSERVHVGVARFEGGDGAAEAARRQRRPWR